jgi:glycyl-tRNA synthetase
MLELDTTIMTPAPVFEASGHVARFADWMVKDTKTGDVLRADHLVKNVLGARLAGDKEARGLAAAPVEDEKKRKKKSAKAVAVKLEDAVVKEYEVILAQVCSCSNQHSGSDCRVSLITIVAQNWANYARNTISEIPTPTTKSASLSSSTSCSKAASGQLANTQGESIPTPLFFSSYPSPPFSFLRPETAQGHFLNFARLLDFNNGRIPFASAQIGRSFRNEISPRAGLLRVREFTMAEIEHFVDPDDKSHARFSEVRDVVLSLLPRQTQEAGLSQTTQMSVGDAVQQGVIANETLGYFVARISQFLLKIGIEPAMLRFRQHMGNEMAHYATDCWDAEIQGRSDGGWTECVGCADRAAYDLSVHSQRTGQALVVRQALKEPIVTEREVPEFNKKVVGKTFKQDAATLQKLVEDMAEPELLKLKGELAQGLVFFCHLS